MSDGTDSTEPDERVQRTDVGASAAVEITRGTGTRDQEKYKLKGKGEGAEEAVEELRRVVDEVFETDRDEPLGDQVREFQPEIGEDGEGDDDA